MRSQQRNRTEPARIDRAFTLIELMVVVSIIAVLISILLPSLGAAREQAKIVKCAAQMRQLGVAARYYAADQGGWLPGQYSPWDYSVRGDPSAAFPLWAEVMAPYLGGEKQTVAGTHGVRGDVRDCPLSQMFAKMPLLQCPSWPGGRDAGLNNCPTTPPGITRRRGGDGAPRAAKPPSALQSFSTAGLRSTTVMRLAPSVFTTFTTPSPPVPMINTFGCSGTAEEGMRASYM